ncbi:uncharacterized protein LOC125945309 [Dermacentor silvarum]|uniref:uncharacterized protein LOC125945309 n=1 Tax=Dermacentor silvarum TaxID=543639 RepID=UPI002100FC87|nr:uncharacterized protein LOC125945309 [Dermacentor silvarum]
MGFDSSDVTTTTEATAPNIIIRYNPGKVTSEVSSVPTTTPTTQKTETPTASTAAPTEMMDDQPLVCTMGRSLNSTRMFPPDGLCEYIFFDSLEKDGRNSLAAPNLFDANLLIFIDAAQLYKITAFGIGISYDAAYHLELFLNRSAMGFKPLEPFWANSIYHIGVLDTATVNPREFDVTAALRCLKVLRDRYSQEIIAQGIKVFTVFAAIVPDGTWANYYTRNFANWFAPDLFIAFGHYPRGDNTLPNCRVVPPTLLHQPRDLPDSYQHSMTTAFESFHRLSAPSLTLKYALSVTMKGRLAVLTDPAQHGFFSPCEADSTFDMFESYAQVCKSPSFLSTRVYEPLVDATQIPHFLEPIVFSYDDRVGLCKKLCTVKAQGTSVKFGIAVFDLDYADFSNTCESKGGPFSRLHLIRSVLNFFRTRFRTTADTADCVNLAT